MKYYILLLLTLLLIAYATVDTQKEDQTKECDCHNCWFEGINTYYEDDACSLICQNHTGGCGPPNINQDTSAVSNHT